eukprot:3441834-Rhodomonas_salina.1
MSPMVRAGYLGAASSAHMTEACGKLRRRAFDSQREEDVEAEQQQEAAHVDLEPSARVSRLAQMKHATRSAHGNMKHDQHT